MFYRYCCVTYYAVLAHGAVWNNNHDNGTDSYFAIIYATILFHIVLVYALCVYTVPRRSHIYIYSNRTSGRATAKTDST
jgi:hypothetical protein